MFISILNYIKNKMFGTKIIVLIVKKSSEEEQERRLKEKVLDTLIFRALRRKREREQNLPEPITDEEIEKSFHVSEEEIETLKRDNEKNPQEMEALKKRVDAILQKVFEKQNGKR